MFLGTLAVVPRDDFKMLFDECGMFNKTDLDTGLRESLKEIFTLPSSAEAYPQRETDLVLDVMIPKYQSGEVLAVDVIPVFWRPIIKVSARLYYLNSGKTKTTYTVVERMRWRDFISRLFSWRAVFSIKPLYDHEDMDYLLYKACHKLLVKIQKAI